MPDPDEKEKEKEKSFTKEFVEKWAKTSEKEKSPEEVILEKQKKLLERDPKNVRIWYARGLLLMDMGRNDEALDCFRQVVQINPSQPGVWNAMAEVLRRLNKPEEAANSLRKALEYIAPQIDEKFREKIRKEEDIDEILKTLSEAKILPEEMGAAEEVRAALEELEQIEGKEIVVKVPGIKEEEYLEKLKLWESQGYDIGPLREVLENEPYKVRTAFFHFEQNVAKIGVLKETLEGIKTPGFEEDIRKISEAMKAPYNIWKVEAGLGDLLARVENKEAELAAEREMKVTEIPPPPPLPPPPPEKVPPRRRAVVPVKKPVSLTPIRGRVNGLAPPGAVNGLVNGLQNTRRGLTNGLTDPTGLTNGLGSAKFRRDMKLRRWKIYIIPIIATLLLFVPVFNIHLAKIPPPPGGVIIDGNSEDWSGVPGYVQTQDVPADNINITNYKMLLKDELLSFILQVKGSIFSNTANYDSFYAFIDADGIESTGYSIDGLGADFLIELTGMNLTASIATLSRFTDSNPGGNENWSAWISFSSVRNAFSGNTLEFQLPSSILNSSTVTFNIAKFEVMLVSDNNQGITGSSIAKMGAVHGALIVRQEGGPITIAQGTAADLLTVTFEAIGNTVHVDQMEFITSPQTIITNPPINFDVAPGQTVTRRVAVDTSNSAYSDYMSLEVENVIADFPVTIVGEPAKAYVGAIPVIKQVDGIFLDWYPSDLITDSETGTIWPASLDIVQYGANRTNDNAYFYIEMRGQIIAGSDVVHKRETGPTSVAPPGEPRPLKLKKGEDLLRVYIDSNSTDSKGLPILGLNGADYKIEIKGKHGRITEKSYYRWLNDNWFLNGTVEAVNHLNAMEIGFDIVGITVQSMQIAFESSDWRRVVDTTEVSSVRSRSYNADDDLVTYERFYGVTFPSKLSDETVVKYNAGRNTLEWTLPKEIVQVDGQSEFIIARISDSVLEIGEDYAEYRSAYVEPDIDIRYQIEETSLKEMFIITQPLDPILPSSSGSMKFTFETKIGENLMVYIDGSGPQERITTSQQITFIEDHKEVFSIQPAMAWDSAGIEINIPYIWEKSGPTLSLEVPVSYLLEASYPVYIDPWVNYTIKNEGPLNSTTEQFGYSVAIGDFNYDGYADLLTGAWANAKNYSLGGAAYIFMGPLTSDMTIPDVNINGSASSNRKGTAVAAGKFNNDDYWDALVTQYLDKPALIYYGQASWPLWVTSADVIIDKLGSGFAPRFGYSAAAGNVDNTNYDDIIIGAPGNQNVNTADGAAFVFLSPFSSPVTSADFTLLPPTNSSGQFGSSIATGLVDDDSLYDVIVGEPIYDGTNPSLNSLGRVSLFKGSNLTSGGQYKKPSANLSGEKIGERFGWSVAVGKLDSDNYEDLAVGAPYNGLSGEKNGKVYLYLSSSSGITTDQSPTAEVTNQSIGEEFGSAVLIGPVMLPNNYNLVVGAPKAAAGGTSHGAVYVFETPLTSSTPAKTQTGDFDDELFGWALAGGKFSNDDFYRVVIGARQFPGSNYAGRVVVLYHIPEFFNFSMVVISIAGIILGFSFRKRKLKRRKSGNI